jgi:hypothetical protein
MMKHALALLLALFATAAFANPPPKPAPKPTPATPAAARSVSDAKAIGSATANPTATGGAASLTNNITLAPQTAQAAAQPAQAIPSDITVKNVPDVTVMIASPTAYCRNTFGFGVSVAGFGGGVGSSELDPGCDTREDARLLFNMGLKDESIARLCAKPEMAVALKAKCEPKQ